MKQKEEEEKDFVLYKIRMKRGIMRNYLVYGKGELMKMEKKETALLVAILLGVVLLSVVITNAMNEGIDRQAKVLGEAMKGFCERCEATGGECKAHLNFWDGIECIGTNTI